VKIIQYVVKKVVKHGSGMEKIGVGILDQGSGINIPDP
jgi:hypothetical protein